MTSGNCARTPRTWGLSFSGQVARWPPGGPPRQIEQLETRSMGPRSEEVQVEVLVAMDTSPIHAWTVPGSTPRDSHRQAAVWRGS